MATSSRRSSSKSKSASRSGKKSSASRRGTGKRELISPRGDKRYVRRSSGGRFSESDDVGRSLSTDRRQHTKTKSKPGMGDRGDR